MSKLISSGLIGLERDNISRLGMEFTVGNRLAEMQLRVLWEEILKRFEFVEVVATPERSYSTFIRGFKRLEVKLHPR